MANLVVIHDLRILLVAHLHQLNDDFVRRLTMIVRRFRRNHQMLRDTLLNRTLNRNETADTAIHIVTSLVIHHCRSYRQRRRCPQHRQIIIQILPVEEHRIAKFHVIAPDFNRRLHLHQRTDCHVFLAENILVKDLLVVHIIAAVAERLETDIVRIRRIID